MTGTSEFSDLSKIDPNMPMRLDVAARLAFPDGSIKASSLRSEARKGRLEMIRIANKDMVTLAAIDAMKKLCLIRPAESVPKPNAPLRRPSQPSQADEAALAQAAAMARVRKLRESLEGTAPKQAAGRRRPRRRDSE